MTPKHGSLGKRVRMNSEMNAILVLGLPMVGATALALLLLMWLERV